MSNLTISNISIPPTSPEQEVLENIVRDFPESAYARLLLMYQRKNNESAADGRLIEENFLYFKNARWIKFLLNDWSSQTESSDTGHYAISFPKPGEHVQELSVNENVNALVETPNSDNFFNGQSEQLAQEISEEIPGDKSEINDYNEDIAEASPNETLTVPAAEEDAPLFEPLHTTDYFASQGIKISEESISDDKLGKQVKSFTEWLKSMKKIHPSKLVMQNEGIEQLVQTAAEQSNAEADIITEAMADVLLRQGKIAKAVEIYEKLSLIYPTKSAYFAAKIESLKQQ